VGGSGERKEGRRGTKPSHPKRKRKEPLPALRSGGAHLKRWRRERRRTSGPVEIIVKGEREKASKRTQK